MRFDLVAMTILESCSKFLSFKIAIYTHRIAIGIYQLKLSTFNLFYFIIQFHPYFLFFFSSDSITNSRPNFNNFVYSLS